MKRQVLEVLSGKGNTSALTTNDLFILVNEVATDVFVTGGTYSSGTTVFTNNTGGTFNVTGFYVPSATTAYKVFTALLTQSGGDNIQYINWDDNPNTLTIGVTYTITENTATDFIPNGAPNNDVGTSFIATSSVVKWDKSNTGPNQVSYNTGAPIATVLENTIGNIWFIYDSDGQYYVNSDALFISNKTALFGGSTYYADDTTLSFGFNFANNNLDTSSLLIQSIVINADTRTNDIFKNAPIEIRVYN